MAQFKQGRGGNGALEPVAELAHIWVTFHFLCPVLDEVVCSWLACGWLVAQIWQTAAMNSSDIIHWALD